MKSLANKKYGKESFKCSDSQPTGIDAYFTCLVRLKPLFENSNFQDSTPSFYINYIGKIWVGNFGSVRLTYFTNDGAKTKKAIDDFLRTDTTVELLEGTDFRYDPDKSGKTAPGKDDDEERWRNFCRAYSYMGLDLLYYNILCSRKLALDYRLNYFPQRLPAKQLLEPAFRNHSSFFNSELNEDYSTEEFWEDLDCWSSGYGPWNHFFINMLLPGEIHEFFPELSYLFNDSSLKQPLTEEQKMYISNRLNLNLSGNWKSDCSFV